MNPQMREFEKDPHLKKEMQKIVEIFHIGTVIETGTEFGGTANAFAGMVQDVITMDVEKKWWDGDLLPNVFFILGNSKQMLPVAVGRALSICKSPFLFYLDAHSSIDNDECPLREELKIIGELRWMLDSPVVVIHDCLVPGTNFGYDTYRGNPLSLEYVRDLLPAIYPDGRCSTRYNTVAGGSSRGVLFIEPA